MTKAGRRLRLLRLDCRHGLGDLWPGGGEGLGDLGAHCQTAQLTHPIGVTLAIPYKFEDELGDHSGGQVIATDQLQVRYYAVERAGHDGDVVGLSRPAISSRR
jgi:hypothetical protein